MMKKMICIVLLCLLQIICVFSSCQAYEEEIRMQNIPWLSSLNSFTNTLDKIIYGKIDVRKKNIVIMNTQISYMGQTRESFIEESEYDLGVKYIYSIHGDDYLVGGYPVSYISGNTLYNSIHESNKDKDIDSRVINAEYKYDSERIESLSSAYDDLLHKLKSIYGEPAEYDFEGIINSVIWYGAQQTYTELKKYMNDDSSIKSISIEYGITNARELIEEMLPKIYGTDSNNTEGL